MHNEDYVEIVEMQYEHWKSVKSIYDTGIRTGNATFENQIQEWEQWDLNHLKNCRFIGQVNSEIIGWVALSPVSKREVYRGVAEVSIYIKQSAQGKGFGKKLLKHVIEYSEKYNIWTLQAGIFPENEASIQLHKKSGFRIVGYREKIGKMKGVWRDVILFERRSKVAGLD